MALRTLLLVLSLALGAAGGMAQPAKPGGAAGPAHIDTREECTALSGAWVNRGAWQFACQTPWDRAECLKLGGSWTPMAAAPNNGLCIAQVSQGAVAKQCNDSGGNWGPPGSAMPFCRPGEARPAVVRKAPDAGKLCDSQTDCTYGCIYQGPPVKPKADVMGHCRANNAPDGCYSMVEKGRLAGQVCLN